MTPRQKAFIESVVSMDNGSNRPVLETALKLYIMNEGVDDYIAFRNRRRGIPDEKSGTDSLRRVGRRIGRRIGATLGHAGRALTSDPVAESRPAMARYDVSQARAAVDAEHFLHTWDHDYTRMLQALDYIGYYLKNYGSREIMQVITSDDFKASLAIGDEIDRIRQSPALGEKERVRTYIDMVESIRTPGNSSTVDTILSLFEASNEWTVIPALTEGAAGASIMQLNNELAVVRNFNAAHGSTPWRRWHADHRADFATGCRNNWSAPTDTDDYEDD